jgi:hypothetical protein
MSIRRETPGGVPALENALAERGLPFRVEGRAGLAVLIAGEATVARMGDAELRRAALALAREHGFTHVAIELRSEPDVAPRPDAPLSRD